MLGTRTLAVPLLILGLATGLARAAQGRDPARAEPPVLPDEKSMPFGEAVDGLACRIIVPADLCHGQPISLTVQIKNVTEHPLYVLDSLDPQFTNWVRLSITNPDGKEVRQTNSAQRGFGTSSFTRLDAGESRRFDMARLDVLFQGGPGGDPFRKDGKYTVGYQFHSPRIPDKSIIGERSVVKDGKSVRERIFEEVTPEQKKFAWAGAVSAPSISFNATAPGEEDLAVHEWGVFTVFNDVKYANVNRQAEWGGLPDFFYRQFPKQRLKWEPAMWDKPIVYFYTKRPQLNVDLRVRFADGGAPVVWWPCAIEPLNNGMSPAPQSGIVPRFDSLRWDLWLGDIVPSLPITDQTAWHKAQLFDLPADSWVTAARVPGAALVTAAGTNPQEGKPWAATRAETERFVFYDGLVPAPDFLRCADADEASITLKNAAGFEMPAVYVIDRRTGAFAAARTSLAPGQERKIVLAPGDLGAMEKAVRDDLLQAGLFAPEADALLKIWHKGFFENAGVVAFYVLPRAEYERMLPMQITPAPAKPPVRVGIAFHPNLQSEPAMNQRIAGLVKQLDDDDYHKRQEARQGLLEIGPAAMHALGQAKSSASANASALIDGVLQEMGAAEWLSGPAKPDAGETLKPLRQNARD